MCTCGTVSRAAEFIPPTSIITSNRHLTSTSVRNCQERAEKTRNRTQRCRVCLTSFPMPGHKLCLDRTSGQSQEVSVGLSSRVESPDARQQSWRPMGRTPDRLPLAGQSCIAVPVVPPTTKAGQGSFNSSGHSTLPFARSLLALAASS